MLAQLSVLRSLRAKLIALFVVSGLVPLAVLGVLSYRQASAEMRRTAGSKLADIAFNASDKLDRNLFERYGDVQAFAKSDPAKSMDPDRLERWMNTMMATYTPIYRLMVVADASGHVVAANTVDLDGHPLRTRALVGLDVSDAAWFQQAARGRLKDGETLVEDLHADDLMRRAYGDGAASRAMSFTYPIKADSGRIVGVWTNRFNWQVAPDILAAVKRRAAAGGAHVDLTLLSSRGIVLDGGSPGDTLTRSVADSAVARAALERGANGSTDGRGLGTGGKPQLLGYFHSAGYSVYPGIGWSVVAGQSRSEALAAAAALRTKTLVVGLLAALALGIGAFVVARRVTRPIEELVAASEAAASGDLTVRSSSGERSDELGRLARAFDTMIENLAQLVGRIGGASRTLNESATQMASNSTEVGSAVEEIARAVGDVAQGAERQMQMLEDARNAAEDMAERVHESARRAEESATTADGARGVAEDGVSAAERATEAVRCVRDSSAVVDAAIRELAAKSEQIGGIVETITGIASQTNLLALNAAIEAARAGEQGRGFAVVAEEVRKLAEEAQTAAGQIAQLVEETQAQTQRAVEVVSEGVRQTEAGAATVGEARDAFLQIGRSVDDVSGRAASIASTAREISAGAARLQQSVVEVAAVAEQSSASTEQVSASTQETAAAMQTIAATAGGLLETAAELSELVARFRLETA